MKKLKSAACCSSGGSCCATAPKTKELAIDFLYLDLNTCERCRGTGTNLDEAIRDVSAVLNAAGFALKLNKVNITSKELAVKYQFLSSPTIRINGNDIMLDVKESNCKECGDICGDDVDCRVWEYEGVEYTEPPKSMIVNAILKAVYGVHEKVPGDTYALPENLEKFFDSKERKTGSV